MNLLKAHWQKVLVGFLVLGNLFVWYVIRHETRNGELKVSLLDVGQGSAIFIDGPGGIQVLIDASKGKRLLSELGRVMPFYDRSIDVVIGQGQDDLKKRYDILLPDFLPNPLERIALGKGAYLSILSSGPITARLDYGSRKLKLSEKYPIEIEGKFYNPNFTGRVLATSNGNEPFVVKAQESTKADILANNKVAELLSTAVSPLQKRAKESDCQINGPYPDPDCTPGAVFPNATVEQICVSGYTRRVRSVSVSLKKRVYASYGIPYPQKTGTYEADHLIPLAIGGSNDIANLFPESGEPRPGFKEKDLVENYLHQEVCAGHLDLGAAQKQIANDWLAVYKALSPEQIKILKGQFANWAK